MKISIVTPTFNSEATLQRTIDSIKAQNYENYEHVIADNCSTDRTREIAEQAYAGTDHLIFKAKEDSGISDAFNNGINAATGEIIAILNSDDEYAHAEVFNLVAKAFENPEIMFTHGDMLFIDEDHGTNVRAPLLCSLEYALPYNHPTMFLRASLYETIGLFKVDYRYTMDYELICRMHESPTQMKIKASYLKGEPLVNMYAGGASWQHELKSIDEVERCLREHGFWTSEAESNQKSRRSRIKAKTFLSKIGLDPLVKIWRNYKWKNS